MPLWRDILFRVRERQEVRKGQQPGASPVALPELDKGDSRDKAGKSLGINGGLSGRVRNRRPDPSPRRSQALSVVFVAGRIEILADVAPA